MFVPARAFQPSLMFVSMAGAYPCEDLFRCSTLEWTPGLTHKHNRTGLERPVRDKHTSLLRTIVNYRRKKVYSIGPCPQCGWAWQWLRHPISKDHLVIFSSLTALRGIYTELSSDENATLTSRIFHRYFRAIGSIVFHPILMFLNIHLGQVIYFVTAVINSET